MTRYHRMPFGAETAFEGTRFALWAPSAEAVDVVIERPGQSADGAMVPGEQHDLPMVAHPEGWFELKVPDIGEGDIYRFRPKGGRVGAEGLLVPDPASRFQPFGVHGASQVIDPDSYSWNDAGWSGRPWAETVIYELHVGTFTREGTFLAAMEHLDHLVELGVTAVELMPVAACPGRYNWGYDGVFPFSPYCRYGRPDNLKQFIDVAHQRGLMVFLDVVYNHFGPEGNYLHLYADAFFDHAHHTPWGAALNFDKAGSRHVRDFFIHNALYWIEEYHLDGLRLDAVHAIRDASRPDILEEIAEAVHHGPGADRPVHLILENDHNEARYLDRGTGGRPHHYVAQWNDDIHHCFHALLTGEDGGYYRDYQAAGHGTPAELLVRCLTEGFAYQGEASAHRGGRARGTRSGHLPPTAFVAFLQNHDQIGNRAFGERLDHLAEARAVEAALAVVLLSPQPPLLFMGEEWAASTPFQYFCDFGPDLADSVRQGRRDEFRSFPEFRAPEARNRIPDPLDQETFRGSRLDWAERQTGAHAARLAYVQRLLALRRETLMPRLTAGEVHATRGQVPHDRVIHVQWTLGDGAVLTVVANLGPGPQARVPRHTGAVLFESHGDCWTEPGTLNGWSTVWFLQAPAARES